MFQAHWLADADNLRTFIECAPGMMWISDPAGTVQFFNQAWRNYAGEIEKIENVRWRNFVHPDDHLTADVIRRSAVAQGVRYDVQVRLRRASDGEFRWHIASVAPVRIDGRLAAWIGSAKDIHDRVIAETAMRESEASFRTMADAIPQLAWMRDPQSQSLWLNRRWREYTGRSLADLQRAGWEETVHPDHYEPLMRLLGPARAKGEAWEYSCPLRGANDIYRWFLIRAVPVREEGSGAVVRWIGTATDVHEDHELQDRQQMLAREVSHRVKNSLALVAGLLTLQARSLDEGETAAALLDAYSRVQTIASVHDHLWRQSDIESVEIKAFLSELCRKLQESAPEHQITFEASFDLFRTRKGVPIGLLVNELVTNALKYAYPAGRAGAIMVTADAPAPDRLSIAVTDRGVGLPADFSLDAYKDSLGMKLIANTIRQLGGEMVITDERPGTRFQITMADHSAASTPDRAQTEAVLSPLSGMAWANAETQIPQRLTCPGIG